MWISEISLQNSLSFTWNMHSLAMDKFYTVVLLVCEHMAFDTLVFTASKVRLYIYFLSLFCHLHGLLDIFENTNSENMSQLYVKSWTKLPCYLFTPNTNQTVAYIQY